MPEFTTEQNGFKSETNSNFTNSATVKQIRFVNIQIHSQIASVKALRQIDKIMLCTLISLIKTKRRHHIYV